LNRKLPNDTVNGAVIDICENIGDRRMAKHPLDGDRISVLIMALNQ